MLKKIEKEKVEVNEENEKGDNQKEKDKRDKNGQEWSGSGKSYALKLQELVFLTLFKLDLFMIINGQRRYGKTIWVRWILSQIWQYYPDGGYVFTRSKHNKFWSQHFPNRRIYNGLGEKHMLILQKILETQRQKHEKMILSDNFEKCPYIVSKSFFSFTQENRSSF